ncbi:NADH dehydrogenase [ubiquinone] 1 beta subcomplex subunit 11, mitochondrial [Gouania willdenowi]|uniref:NADH dehydrogenase [ubiquinone] 1 beta subcomplex subunit 11, mitochondrial n=1 Tax=Gouania willdenowi TaxID=441366 RepID=A0A8C5HBL5_GOUWI|nr:NADH dehydrogenase [ubiquinone] 1 beta subcomplex subunit 11, mitochondrial [Gouania willdenowi]
MLSRLSRVGTTVPRLLSNNVVRHVSQSKSTGTTIPTTMTELHHGPVQSEHGEVSPYVKNPDYHGFSTDPVIDEWNMKVAFFFGISVVLVIGGTFLHYVPDIGMREWARREAERLIEQREKEGLPLISENYYDTDKIILPTTEQEV